MRQICLLLGVLTTLASAQTMTIVHNSTPVTVLSDDVDFRRDVTHFTFDLAGNSGGFDWRSSEISVDVVGAGRIWHSRRERILDVLCSEPDELAYIHNLQSPALNANASNNMRAQMYDTFFTAPGARFTVDPSFQSPGACHPCVCGIPPIVSTDERIRGIAVSGEEIPLIWYDAVNAPLNNTVLARLTFQVPEGFGDLVVNPTDTTGRQLFATIRGRIWSTENAAGAPYAFEIWQAPEPASATLALFALAVASGIRRSRC